MVHTMSVELRSSDATTLITIPMSVGRCWTADRRLRRGLPSHVRCPLCSLHDETANHLALQCPFAQTVWDGFARRSQIHIPLPGVDSDSVDRLPRKEAKVLNSAVMLILRCLWMERNARVFEGTASTLDQVLHAAIQEWRLWCTGRGGFVRGV
jgi:hypothetical protein